LYRIFSSDLPYSEAQTFADDMIEGLKCDARKPWGDPLILQSKYLLASSSKGEKGEGLS